MKIRSIERAEYTEYYLTVSANSGESTENSAHSIFGEVSEFLAENEIEPIIEKIYGRVSAKQEILSIRETMLGKYGLDLSLPLTFIQGSPFHAGSFAGLQLWGIASRIPGKRIVTTLNRLENNEQGRGWKMDGCRFGYFPSIKGSNNNKNSTTDVTLQARQMLTNAVHRLEVCNFSFSHVVRTWIYLARILDWYDEFNQVRSALFKSQSLDDHKLPASTGIQGRTSNEECFMDLLAVDPGKSSKVRIRRLHSSRQSEAYSYGSAFSRGIAIEMGGTKTIMVSGTSSINVEKSVHLGNPEGQLMDTLLNIAAILEPEGVSLEDICMSTVFCKNRCAWEAVQTFERMLNMPKFPAITIEADVCRPELMIEIEATAIV